MSLIPCPRLTSADLVCVQVEHGCAIIEADPALEAGYHAVGVSQGGLLLRGVAQLCPAPAPRMRTLVTLGTPHQGIFGIPKCSNSDIFDECTLVRNFLTEGAYNAWIQGMHNAQCTPDM